MGQLAARYTDSCVAQRQRDLHRTCNRFLIDESYTQVLEQPLVSTAFCSEQFAPRLRLRTAAPGVATAHLHI